LRTKLADDARFGGTVLDAPATRAVVYLDLKTTSLGRVGDLVQQIPRQVPDLRVRRVTLPDEQRRFVVRTEAMAASPSRSAHVLVFITEKQQHQNALHRVIAV